MPRKNWQRKVFLADFSQLLCNFSPLLTSLCISKDVLIPTKIIICCWDLKDSARSSQILLDLAKVLNDTSRPNKTLILQDCHQNLQTRLLPHFNLLIASLTLIAPMTNFISIKNNTYSLCFHKNLYKKRFMQEIRLRISCCLSETNIRQQITLHVN